MTHSGFGSSNVGSCPSFDLNEGQHEWVNRFVIGHYVYFTGDLSSLPTVTNWQSEIGGYDSVAFLFEELNGQPFAFFT